MAFEPTQRAWEAAQSRGIGSHTASFRVNRAFDRRFAATILVMPIVAAIVLHNAWRWSPWGSGDSISIGTVALGIVVLVLLVVTVWGIPVVASRRFRSGARVHVFDRGAIAERVNGYLYSWSFEQGEARYVCWLESDYGDLHERPQVWVTLFETAPTARSSPSSPAR